MTNNFNQKEEKVTSTGGWKYTCILLGINESPIYFLLTINIYYILHPIFFFLCS